jgi:ferrous iron transport protein B
MLDSGWAFLRRAGTLILMSMILVWALMYFPRGASEGETYDVRVARLQAEWNASKKNADPDDDALQKKIDDQQEEIDNLRGEWKRQSVLGRMGRAIEPAVRPLGWDWKIGMAALASFPAREVVVGTLGIIYNQGQTDSKEIRASGNVAGTKLGQALEGATWDDDSDRKVFTVPTALSLMVFFALCCQCASTLAVIRRETRSWRWPAFTFAYMTALAYVGALVVYQVGSLL